jgi:hypothetical protein
MVSMPLWVGLALVMPGCDEFPSGVELRCSVENQVAQIYGYEGAEGEYDPAESDYVEVQTFETVVYDASLKNELCRVRSHMYHYIEFAELTNFFRATCKVPGGPVECTSEMLSEDHSAEMESATSQAVEEYASYFKEQPQLFAEMQRYRYANGAEIEPPSDLAAKVLERHVDLQYKLMLTWVPSSSQFVDGYEIQVSTYGPSGNVKDVENHWVTPATASYLELQMEEPWSDLTLRFEARAMVKAESGREVKSAPSNEVELFLPAGN